MTSMIQMNQMMFNRTHSMINHPSRIKIHNDDKDKTIVSKSKQNIKEIETKKSENIKQEKKTYEFIQDSDFENLIKYIILPTHNLGLNSSYSIKEYMKYVKDEILPTIKNHDTYEYINKVIDKFFSDHNFEITLSNLIFSIRSLSSEITREVINS